MNLTIDIGDFATSAIALIKRRVAEGALNKVMQRGMVNQVKEHFRRLDSQRANALSGRRSHFYADASRETHAGPLNAESFTVAISKVGVAQRYYGGQIRAVKSKWLTIPVHKKTYNRAAREFDLDFRPVNNELAFLVFPNKSRREREEAVQAAAMGQSSSGGSRKRRRAKGGPAQPVIAFVLKREVWQEPDPSVLPTDEELEDEAVSAGNEYLQQLSDFTEARRSKGS